MKRDERLRRAALARVLLNAIEKAEQLGEPDIAEIVRDALQELEHPSPWKVTRSRNSPCTTQKRPPVSHFLGVGSGQP